MTPSAMFPSCLARAALSIRANVLGVMPGFLPTRAIGSNEEPAANAMMNCSKQRVCEVALGSPMSSVLWKSMAGMPGILYLPPAPAGKTAVRPQSAAWSASKLPRKAEWPFTQVSSIFRLLLTT